MFRFYHTTIWRVAFKYEAILFRFESRTSRCFAFTYDGVVDSLWIENKISVPRLNIAASFLSLSILLVVVVFETYRYFKFLSVSFEYLNNFIMIDFFPKQLYQKKIIKRSNILKHNYDWADAVKLATSDWRKNFGQNIWRFELHPNNGVRSTHERT